MAPRANPVGLGDAGGQPLRDPSIGGGFARSEWSAAEMVSHPAIGDPGGHQLGLELVFVVVRGMARVGLGADVEHGADAVGLSLPQEVIEGQRPVSDREQHLYPSPLFVVPLDWHR